MRKKIQEIQVPEDRTLVVISLLIFHMVSLSPVQVLNDYLV